MDQALTGCRQQDKVAPARPSLNRLGSLFDTHQRRLYRLARRLSGDGEEARDLVQQVFLRAAGRPASIPADGSGAEAWLVRILVNLCHDRRRRRQVRRAAVPPPPPPPAAGPEGPAVARATVQAALRQLAPRRRTVLVLRELEDLDTAEIARLLGITRVTVRWHLAAARRQLRHWLGATGVSHES